MKYSPHTWWKQWRHWKPTRAHLIWGLGIFLAFVVVSAISVFGWQYWSTHQENVLLTSHLAATRDQLAEVETTLEELRNSDPYKTNDELQTRIAAIESTYDEAVRIYKQIDDIDALNAPEEADIRSEFATALQQLSQQEYASAAATLASTSEMIGEVQAKIATQEQATTLEAAATNQPNAAVSNSAPSSGYQRQVVTTDIGTFTVSLVAGDLNNTRVIVDTASASDCVQDCPVLPLADYVQRNGGYAGINGTYFCPASYPDCADKKNSFDLLVMNKDKTYFNSDNNVYSTNPAVIFQGGSVRFVGQASQWGRDTSVDSVLSNFPLLVSGKNIVFGGDDDPKKGSKGNRSFVANQGNTVYIGVIHAATVAEAAHALKALGMDNALNLDNGGSTALWSGGYKLGPGRNIPNAIIFVRK